MMERHLDSADLIRACSVNVPFMLLELIRRVAQQ